MALYLPVLVTCGAAFWLTARSRFSISVTHLALYVGVFAAGRVIGFVVVFASSGIGVRVAAIVVLLSGDLGEAHAIGLAAASRLVLIAVDLVGGAAALSWLLLQRSRRRPVGAVR